MSILGAVIVPHPPIIVPTVGRGREEIIRHAEAAGAFVSLHAHGRLRGCIGTTGPTTGNVAWEIVQNAVSACSRDPRFPPVTVSELDSLEYSVDVLGEPEAISSPAELDVKKYGVIVSRGGPPGTAAP